MTAHALVRGGLVLLAVVQGAVGGWQLLAPRSFYDDFPWVALLPPFNEHLMVDVGAGSLAMAVVLGAAAVSMERRLVRVSLAATLMFAVPHLVFHTTHQGHFLTADAVSQTITLVVTGAIPTALLILTRGLWGTGRPDDARGRLARLLDIE